ncbi:hypothetical protein FJTKL_01278 [Diaporthe vaccinii]|uniref:Uncharacterized protein n=1 Tax=Diaporthe vaccinii TaxID=105482 RepID=A0ABR4E1D6_9PEZI
MACSLTHLKTLSSKVDSKLQKIKSRLHKTKEPKTTVEPKATLELNLKERETTVEPITTVEPKTALEPNTTTSIPKTTNEGENGNTSGPNHNDEEGEELAPSTSSQTSLKQEKKSTRGARKEARKAEWASRHAAFKTKAKKLGEVVFLPCAVVVGIIFAPFIIVADMVLCVVNVAGWVVVKIFDLMCAPFLVCFVIKQW